MSLIDDNNVFIAALQASSYKFWRTTAECDFSCRRSTNTQQRNILICFYLLIYDVENNY